ncbi:DUF1045 domain-containing protein [Acidovorax sp. Root217]|uniref:DUF1045 domain-containing protein n=1 Tax=Acidovorax sp. Root217 TaxID=1736492 RepID=UPI00070C8A97|nr:DUF1045 domain-containing protein [Acidovorax sp. Root217]KRC27811.1 hypothetical protein ASE31_13430 [Acidovorax sp. Root217]
MTTSNTSSPTAAHHRYAVYFAPNPGTLAWLAGSHWLGRCAALLQPMQPLDIHGVASEELERLTAAPRRYGWHATLKAPFALAPGVDWLTLHHAVQTLASSLRPFAMPPMQVERIDDFLALVPTPSHPANAEIQAAAAACVTQLQPLAAPLSEGDLARRRAAGLTPRQDALLQQWGYPFVLEEFRFHMSLTGSLAAADDETVELVQDAADQFFADLPPLRFGSLALFAEPTPGADFVLLDHLELGA